MSDDARRIFDRLMDIANRVSPQPTVRRKEGHVFSDYGTFRKAGGFNLDVQPEADGNWSFTIQLRDGRRFRGKMNGELDDVLDRILERCQSAVLASS